MFTTKEEALEYAYTPEFRLPIGDKPQFIQCCPTWLRRTQSALEVLDLSLWIEKGCLAAFYNTDHSMPVALNNAYKAFDAGFNGAINEKAKSKISKSKQK